MSEIKGRAFKFGKNVLTSQIIPVQYYAAGTLELAAHCMEGVDPSFARNMSRGDIIVAGSNFGLPPKTFSGFQQDGSHKLEYVRRAKAALKAAGVNCVIAKSFWLGFKIEIGDGDLYLLSCSKADKIRNGDIISVEIRPLEHAIFNETSGETYTAIGETEETLREKKRTQDRIFF